MSISLSVEEVGAMQRQLQELQLVKAELEGIKALEGQAAASLREAAAQMGAAQEIAQVAREKEAEAAVAMRKQAELTDAMEALREEIEQLYESRQQELDAAEAARLDAEADAAVEKATVASERARADALRDAARQMEDKVRAVHEEAGARISAAEDRAHRAEEKLLKLQTDGQATAHETQRLVKLIEEEAAAKISKLESSASVAASRATEADSELATLRARLRAGELHLSAAIEKFKSERKEAVGAALEAAKNEHDAALESVTSSLEAKHTDMHKVALARINSLCADLKAQGDELESLRDENAQLRTKLLDTTQNGRREAAALPGTVSGDSTPRDNLSSPTARVGPAVALIAATRRTDGLEQEVVSLRQEVLRLQKKVAGYRAREQKVIKAAKHSGLRGGSPDRAIQAAQREQERLIREAGRRKRPLGRDSTHAAVVASSDTEDEFLLLDEEDDLRPSVRFDDGSLKSASKTRRKASPRRAAKDRRKYEESSSRSTRAARAHIRTIGTQTLDEVVLVADIEPLLVELPDALSQEVARRQRAEELLQALYQAQQDVVRHSPQATAAPAKVAAVDSGSDGDIQHGMPAQQDNLLLEDHGVHLDALEEDSEEADHEDESENKDEDEDDDDDNDDEMHRRWLSWNDEPAMPPTPKRGDNTGLTIISTGNYSEEDADDAQNRGGPVASCAHVAMSRTDLLKQTAVRTDSSASSAAQDRWALRVDAAVAATMPQSVVSSAARPVSVEPASDQPHVWDNNRNLGLDDSVQDIILDKHDVNSDARISRSGGISPPALSLAELNEIATQSAVTRSVDTPRPVTSKGSGGRGGRGIGRGRAGRGAAHMATADSSMHAGTTNVGQQPSVTPVAIDDASVQEPTDNGLSAESHTFEMQTDRDLLEELEREEEPEDIDAISVLASETSRTLEDGGDELQEEAPLTEGTKMEEGQDESVHRNLLVVCPEGVHSGDPLTISLEDDTEFVIEVPEGVGPGDEIEIQHPVVGEADVSS